MSKCDRCAFKKDSCHYTQTTGGGFVCSAGFSLVKQKALDIDIEPPKNLPKDEADTWHTGTPTEDGEYLVICQYVIDSHYYQEKLVWEFKNGDWGNKQRLTENKYIKELEIIAWYGKKIKPYKENT